MDSFQSLTQLGQLLKNKQISASELCSFYLDRTVRFDDSLNSFVSVATDHVLGTAKIADEAISNGRSRALTGIPIAHKDVFCVRSQPTSCCSKMLRSFIAPYDATVVSNIAEAGGIYFGKTNMDEFAMGTSNQTSAMGPVRNPWDFTRVPGGSSGGSAAAVAAGLVPAATGSDTGGSIRQPASFCGVTGFKPTYGRVSRYGMIAFASSLDQAGTLTLTAKDASLLFQIMRGPDRHDATSLSVSVPNQIHSNHPLTIGYAISLLDELDPRVASHIEDTRTTLEKLGHRFVDVEVFDQDVSLACYYVISCAEASSNLARFDGIRFGTRAQSATTIQEMYEQTRNQGFGDEVKRRLLAGTYFLTCDKTESYFTIAQKIRRIIYELYERVFQQVDVVLAPSAPSTAFQLNEQHEPTEMYRQDRFTVPANLCGLPAISVPNGMIDQLPIGVQFIGPRYGDERILELAERFQEETAWHLEHPVL